MSRTQLEQIGKELYELRQDNLRLFSKTTADGKYDWNDDDRARFKELNGEGSSPGKPEVKGKLAELHDEYKKLERIVNIEVENAEAIDDLKRPRGPAPGLQNDRREERERKSVGLVVTESAAYREFKARNHSGYATIELPDYGVVDLKTTLSTTAGFAPFVARGPDVVPFALRRPTVQDLMPSIGTDSSAVKYMEETTNTRNAAPVAEGASKPESARAWTERTVLVEVVATTIPVTEQQLADVPQMMGIINSTLGQEVELAEEDQLLTGNGTSPQLQGFLTKTGVQTQAKGSDAVPTAFMKALTLIRFTGFAEPSAAVWHPNDWQDVVTLQDLEGRYLFGDPSSINVKQLWGVPAVITPAETENTVLVGDFRMYSYVVRRMGLRIDVGYVNDDFKKNLRTVRAETRLALVIRRPAAFAKLTGV